MKLKNILELILKYFIPNDKNFILSEFSQIEKLEKSKSSRKYEYLNNNKKVIHDILMNNEDIIVIHSNIPEKSLSNLFYLILLITDNLFLTDYIYDFDFIKNANNLRKNAKNELTIFMLSMIIIQLIDNYKQAVDYYDSSYEEKLNQMNEENLKIRNNYKNILNKYNFDLNIKEIKSSNLEEIYSKIIISLIVEEKIKNYEYSTDILNQLDLGKINITDNIFKNLLTIFNSNQNYIQRYSIIRPEDLYDEEKVNFYYLIVKYIFKNSFYIYNISFLNKIRKSILKIIKLNNEFQNNNNNLFKKIEYVIKFFCDSKYYFIKYLGAKYDKLKQVSKFYQTFLFESKKNEIIKLNEYINDLNINNDECEQFLSDYEKAKNMNEREKIIKYILEEENKNINNENDIYEYSKKWEDLEKKIKDKNYKIKKSHKEILKKCFNDKNNKEILLNIFGQDVYNSLINHFNGNKKVEKDNNLNENNDEANIQEEESNIINEEINIEFQATSESLKKAEIDETQKNIYKNRKQLIIKDNENQKDDLLFNKYYDLLYFSEKIGTHKSPAEAIFETNNGYFVSYGEKNLLIYNSEYQKVMEKSHKKSSITCVSEVKIDTSTDKVHLLVSSENQLNEISININNLEDRTKRYDCEEFHSSKYLELKKDTHLVYGGKGLLIVNDLFSKIITTKVNTINNNTYKGAIKMSKNIFAVSSNEILKDGKNILHIYNMYSKALIKEIEGYSFSISPNGLALIPEEENKPDRILLCACKKYTPKDKNGILLVNGNFALNKYSKDIKEPFYDTKNFEVHCFCPVSLKSKESLENIFKKDNSLLTTDFFLAGGFDRAKGKGIIKLYKFIKNENIEDTKIEFIQDIEITKTKNFNGFKDAISSITQSKKDGKILVSSWDGNVYLLSYPNLERFQQLDEITQSKFEVEKKEIIIEA